MGILLWLVIGIAAGIVAKKLMPGPAAGGMAVAIPICAGGALIGGLIGTLFSERGLNDWDAQSLVAAIAGTMIVLLCYRSHAMRAAV